MRHPLVVVLLACSACAPFARPLSPPLFTAGCAAPAAAAPGARSASAGDHARSDRRNEEQPECRMGSDGRQACGYHCKMGSDGVMACADTPDGVCKMGSDGHVVCSQVARGAPDAAGPPPNCHMSSRGQQQCGYNCRFGSDGNWYCASTPNGRCAMNSDGSFSCS